MSVRVRLTRVGSKKNPIWRVVVADQRSPRDGRFIETIGHYNPQTDPSTIRIDEERLQHWLARGAQPSGSVKQLVKAYSKSGGAAAAVAEAAPAEPEAAESGGPQVKDGIAPSQRSAGRGYCGWPSVMSTVCSLVSRMNVSFTLSPGRNLTITLGNGCSASRT